MVRAQLALLGLAVGCGGLPAAGQGAPAAAPGDRAPTGIAMRQVAARGVLTYAAELTGDRLVSVELAERFALVVRARGRQPLRIDLGPPDYDVGDLSVDGDTAWIASTDGTVRAYDLSTGRRLAELRLGARATAVAATDRYLITGTDSGAVCLRRRSDLALLQCAAIHGGAVASIDVAGDRLATASHDGGVLLWSLPSLAVIARHRVEGSANQVRLSPDRTRLAIAVSGDPPVRRSTRGPTDPAARVEVWTPGGDRVSCPGHTGPVTSVAWVAPDTVASGSWDRTVRLWRLPGCRELARLGGFAGLVRRIRALPGTGRLVVSAWSRDLESRATVVLELLYPGPD